MKRRAFIRTATGVACGSLLNYRPFLSSSFALPAQSRIKYIRDQAPSFEVPPYRGSRYEDVVPDTYDLAERAKLAINGLTQLTDAQVDHDVYFLACFYRNPPVLRHESSDPFIQPKFQEALPLMRVITGDEVDSDVDKAWTEGMLRSIGPDGLYYIATQGRPWIREGIMAWTPEVLLPGGIVGKADTAPIDYITNQTVSGRVIGVMTLHYKRDGNVMWENIGKGSIDRWASLAVNKDDFSYYPVALLTPNAAIAGNVPVPTGLFAAEMGHRLIQGLCQFYQATHYEPAIVLANRLSRYLRFHARFYDEHGRFIDGDPEIPRGHYHSHTFGLLGMVEYAIAANDTEMLQFTKQSFEWARDNSYGSALTGWYPESVQKGYRYCEGCCMADMIAIAVKLSQANAGDYWSDVERWLRNQFAEGQFTNVAWVKDVVDKLPRTPVAYNETSDRAIERSVGAFAGYTTGNDYGINSGGIMDPTGVAGCCNGNCTRTIYYAWENILEYKGGALRINLLLNRASEWVDLHSYIPYEGRIDIKVKRPLQNVSLHSPEWLHAGTPAVRCNINGRSRSITWNDRYIEIGSLKPQDHVIIHFPLPETNSQEVIGDGRYALTLRGDTVVHVEPPGHFDRLYERSSYRQRSAPLRSVTRFISDEPLSW